MKQTPAVLFKGMQHIFFCHQHQTSSCFIFSFSVYFHVKVQQNVEQNPGVPRGTERSHLFMPVRRGRSRLAELQLDLLQLEVKVEYNPNVVIL